MERLKDIQNDVENTTVSYRKIATKYDTNHTQIKNFVKKYGWSVKHREKQRVSKVPAKLENKEIEIIPTVELDQHAKELYTRLSTIGKQVFNQLVAELGTYYIPVLNYQIWLASKDFADYLEISDATATQPYTLTSPKTGQPYINPVHNLYKQKRDTLRSSLNELGLSFKVQKVLNLKFERPGQKQASIFDFANAFDMDELDGI